MKFNWIHVLTVLVILYSLWCMQSCRSGYDKPLVGNLIYGAQCSKDEQCISGSCNGTCL